MREKIIIWIAQLIILSVVLGSCDKDDDNSQGDTSGYRIKTITGHNELWGDYKMEYGYTGSRLDSIVWREPDGGKKHIVEIAYKGTDIEAVLYDIVRMVSADSAAKLDPDSIPYSWQNALKIKHRLDRKGSLLDEHISYYAPIPQVEGEKYQYAYTKTGETKFLYEYGSNGGMLVWRNPFYGEYKDMVKNEYVYNGERVDRRDISFYEVSEWKPRGSEIFTYNGDLLVGWQASFIDAGSEKKETKAEYSYSGNQITKITYFGNIAGTWKILKEVSYTYDASGRVTKIDRGNGEWEQVSYEDIPGNSDFFLSKADRVYRLPDLLGHLGTSAFNSQTDIHK